MILECKGYVVSYWELLDVLHWFAALPQQLVTICLWETNVWGSWLLMAVFPASTKRKTVPGGYHMIGFLRTWLPFPTRFWKKWHVPICPGYWVPGWYLEIQQIVSWQHTSQCMCNTSSVHFEWKGACKTQLQNIKEKGKTATWMGKQILTF